MLTLQAMHFILHLLQHGPLWNVSSGSPAMDVLNFRPKLKMLHWIIASSQFHLANLDSWDNRLHPGTLCVCLRVFVWVGVCVYLCVRPLPFACIVSTQDHVYKYIGYLRQQIKCSNYLFITYAWRPMLTPFCWSKYLNHLWAECPSAQYSHFISLSAHCCTIIENPLSDSGEAAIWPWCKNCTFCWIS